METVLIRSKNKSMQVAGWVAQGVGWLVGYYSGINMVIPVAGSFLTFFALKRIASAEKAEWFPAISVQAGHAIWFGIGAMIEFEKTISDSIALFLAIIWLYFKPGQTSVVVVSLCQLLALGLNLYLFLGTEVGSVGNKALLVHIVFRISAIGLMWLPLSKWRNLLLASPVPS